MDTPDKKLSMAGKNNSGLRIYVVLKQDRLWVWSVFFKSYQYSTSVDKFNMN